MEHFMFQANDSDSLSNTKSRDTIASKNKVTEQRMSKIALSQLAQTNCLQRTQRGCGNLNRALFWVNQKPTRELGPQKL